MHSLSGWNLVLHSLCEKIYYNFPCNASFLWIIRIEVLRWKWLIFWRIFNKVIVKTINRVKLDIFTKLVNRFFTVRRKRKIKKQPWWPLFFVQQHFIVFLKRGPLEYTGKRLLKSWIEENRFGFVLAVAKKDLICMSPNHYVTNRFFNALETTSSKIAHWHIHLDLIFFTNISINVRGIVSHWNYLS